MNPVKNHFFHNHISVTEEQAEQISQTGNPYYPVKILPPRNKELPATLQQFTKAITEIQTQWLGLKNTSPTIVYEIQRLQPRKLQFQYFAPTKRLERKIRLHLSNQIPQLQFKEGNNRIPIEEGNTVGGGLLTTGRTSFQPLQYEHKDPPNNSVAAALHRHATPRTRYIIQILFKPVAGRSIQNWVWKKQAVHHRNYLRKKKENLWSTVNPTTREKTQAKEIDHKVGSPRFKTSIRLLIINAGEYTSSRAKEISGAFNTYENPETGQYLDTVTIRRLRKKPFLSFAETVARRRFQSWTRSFQTSTKELAALLSLPDKQQKNISYSQR